jgi:hypothetical protein
MGSGDLQSHQTPVHRLGSIYSREQSVGVVLTVSIFAKVDASPRRVIEMIILDRRAVDDRSH